MQPRVSIQKNRLITKLKGLISRPAKPKPAPQKSQTKPSKMRLKIIQREKQQEELENFNQRLKNGNPSDYQEITVAGLTKQENKRLNRILKGEHEG